MIVLYLDVKGFFIPSHLVLQLRDFQHECVIVLDRLNDLRVPLYHQVQVGGQVLHVTLLSGFGNAFKYIRLDL